MTDASGAIVPGSEVTVTGVKMGLVPKPQLDRNQFGGGGRILRAKSFPVRQGQQIQFRLEAFKAFHIPQFGNPSGTLGNSTFGVISSTQSNNREMLVSLT